MKSLIALLMIWSGAALAGTNAWVTLTWDANTEADLSGYKLYMRTNDGMAFRPVHTNGKQVVRSAV